MIGNAVPIVFAQKIAEQIHKDINEYTSLVNKLEFNIKIENASLEYDLV